MKKLLSARDSRQLLGCLLFLFVLFSSFKSIAQSNNYSDAFIESCIREIFQEQADELVFNSSSARYSFMSNFMKNQVVVEYHPEYAGKGFESTNSLSLNNKYNSNMQKDTSYNEVTFNPLKYQLPMNTNKKIMYRIADTDYILIINPRK